MHLSRNKEQFLSLAKVYIEFWMNSGELSYATWFGNYIKEPWCNWFITASKIGGIIPDQNPIESHHKRIKKCCVSTLRAATVTVLNDTLPMILINDNDIQFNSFGYVCAGRIPAEVFYKAKTLTDSKNYRPAYSHQGDHKTLEGFELNSSKYVVSESNINGIKVTKCRASRYLRSLEGLLISKKEEKIDVKDINILFLSMHFLKIKKHDLEIQKLSVKPVYSIEDACKYLLFFFIFIVFYRWCYFYLTLF